MTIKPYHSYNDPIFNNPVKPVDNRLSNKKLLEIVQDLYDTHFQNKENIGVGLAANQIGYSYSVFLSYVSEEVAKKRHCPQFPLSFWVNATYKSLNDETNLGPEGCYSVPKLFARYVKRFNSVKIDAEKIEFSKDDAGILSITGSTPKSFVLHGLHARLFQHEIDHLDLVRPRFYFEYVEGGIDALEPIENYYASFNKEEK